MRIMWALLIYSCLWLQIRAAEVSPAFALSADEQAIVEQTNAQRHKAGLPALRPNALLFSVARQHANAMARAQKLEHRLNGKNSSARVEAAGYRWLTVSENIAWNQRSVAEVMDGWMRSEGHRTNLLASDICDIGVGVALDSQRQPYWVQVFARPEPQQTQSMPQEFSRPEPTPLTELKTAELKTSTKFSLSNTGPEELSVDVHADHLFALKSGETVSYSLTTVNSPPWITIQSGENLLEFKVHQGGCYTLNKTEHAIVLIQSDAQPR